jgi:hypothetical protein
VLAFAVSFSSSFSPATNAPIDDWDKGQRRHHYGRGGQSY